MTTSWNPEQYLRFAAERARPFDDLLNRVSAALTSADRIVDLGCGPGNMTAALAERFPAARVVGIDSSPEMIAAAQRYAGDRIGFALGDLREWRPEEPVDLIISNAVLQWVPRHTELFEGWLSSLRPGGVLAFQMPVPASTEPIRMVAQRPQWTARLSSALSAVGPRGANPVHHPETYVDELARMGCAVDAWETTYYHVLGGADPVLEWLRGTGLRPYLDALADDPAARDAFEAEVRHALREAYPAQSYGTVLPFHRIFVVATT